MSLMLKRKEVDNVKIKFVREKETKNTVRFQEVVDEDGNPVVGMLYVQKSALKELDSPEELVVQIEKA